MGLIMAAFGATIGTASLPVARGGADPAANRREALTRNFGKKRLIVTSESSTEKDFRTREVDAGDPRRTLHQGVVGRRRLSRTNAWPVRRRWKSRQARAHCFA